MDTEGIWKKNITFFLTGQTISLFGSMLVQYAITWYITLETQSGMMMALSIICGFVPTFLISPFAGVWADRYNRKLLIILADSMIAVATLVLALLFLMDYGSIGLLFAASAVRSLGSGIQTPAIGAYIPQLVPEDQLTRINGTNSSIQAFVMLVAPILSAALLYKATIEAIFFIDVVTAAIAIIILLLFLNVPAHAKALESIKISYFEDVREGLAYIRNHRFIKTLFIYTAINHILISPMAFLTPLQVTRSFGDDVWRLTAIEVTFSIGMILGGVIMASWGGFKNKSVTIITSIIVMAACTVALGIVRVFPVYLFFMAVVGIAIPMLNTPFTVLLQLKVEPDFQGRVFGVLTMISSSLMPLAMLVYGPTADFIKIEWLLMVTGVLMLVECFAMLRNKVIIEAGKVDEIA